VSVVDVDGGLIIRKIGRKWQGRWWVEEKTRSVKICDYIASLGD
jgi:hypothetical protein